MNVIYLNVTKTTTTKIISPETLFSHVIGLSIPNKYKYLIGIVTYF